MRNMQMLSWKKRSVTDLSWAENKPAANHNTVIIQYILLSQFGSKWIQFFWNKIRESSLKVMILKWSKE